MLVEVSCGAWISIVALLNVGGGHNSQYPYDVWDRISKLLLIGHVTLGRFMSGTDPKLPKFGNRFSAIKHLYFQKPGPRPQSCSQVKIR